MNDIAKIDTTSRAVPSTPADLLKIAVEGNADIDKLEKLMQLQARWEEGEARKAYIAAMAKFRDQCPIINKSRNGHNSRYAGLPETIQAIQGLLSDNELSFSWDTSQDGNLVTVTCRVTHVQGHSETTSLSAAPDSTGSKNAIQAVGSTVTYLQRYTLYSLLGLASKEMDDDGAGAGSAMITEDQARNLECLISEVKADEQRFLTYMRVGNIRNIPASKYDEAVTALERKR